MLPLSDPEPSAAPRGDLVPTGCHGCGRITYVRDTYAGPVGCIGCWASKWGVDTMRPIAIPRHLLARYAGGDAPVLGQGPGMYGRTAPAAANRELIPTGVRSSSSTRPTSLVARPRTGAASGAYRVLIAAQPATPSQIPAGAAALLAAAGAAGREATVTYSLAEELATGRLVHAVAVRLAGLGYACWSGGGFTSAYLAGRRVTLAGEALAIVSGVPYEAPAAREAPVRGPCPRCGRDVRWKLPKAGPPLPYAHQRPSEAEGGRGLKIVCA